MGGDHELTSATCETQLEPWHFETQTSTDNDRYSVHGYSGIHRYSGTKNPDDAILFTVSGITAIVEQKFRKIRFFPKILMRI